MPKTPSTSTHRQALRRNQACRSCRKRKLKCDASRPHCGTCVKQWQVLISVPAPIGYAHPTEPQCSYDPVEGLPLAPDTDPLEKIRQLESEVAQLKSMLHKQTDQPFANSSPHMAFLSPPLTSPVPASRVSTEPGPIVLPHVSLSVSPTAEYPEPYDTSTSFAYDNAKYNGNPDIFMDLLFSGWNPELPDPATLLHYVDIFFKCDPCGSRVFHRPSFLASLHLPPADPGFPHSAILHAMCALASRWSPQRVVTLPDGTKRDQFAEYHAGKARSYIDKTMASGESIFSVMQACVLLSWYFYHEGRWVEVWIFAGFQTRVAVPLQLNHRGTFSPQITGGAPAYLGPPKDMQDLELRRRTWWMTILFDRIASVGGWIHGVDERDIATELPLRMDDFEHNIDAQSNPQSLSTPDLYITHPPQFTDSFLLLMKSVMLFGKVTDFNVRGKLHAVAPPSKTMNPFHIPSFKDLDQLVHSRFLRSLPQMFSYHAGVSATSNGAKFDTDLYMVHVIPHAATITLHNHFIDFTDPQNISASRCVESARFILGAYYDLAATSLDISRLHPFITICWYLAAVVQVQLCKYFIEIEDREREATVWGEINTLRFAMMEYGHRSPIGTRQEKLLRNLMQEIMRLTVQKSPLQVGIPLYPFSHTSLFRKDEPPRETLQDGAAPLPNSFEEEALPLANSIATHQNLSETREWSSTCLSASPQGV